MKITDRINKLRGVVESKYDFDSKTLSIRYNSSADIDILQIQVVKIVADLQLKDSVTKFVFQNGGTL